MRYVVAPPEWTCTGRNPFTENGSYGLSWSGFVILDHDDDQYITGRGSNGLFSARFGRRVDHLKSRLTDFIHYENAYGRTVIVSAPPDVSVDRFVAEAVAETPGPQVIRADDPEVIVHATTVEAWRSIQSAGELVAASQLPSKPRLASSATGSEVEQYYENEPPEYHDFIMFAPLGATTPEKVLASYRAGRFLLSDDVVYEPGVRLYLDNHAIIRAGLDTRDGLHTAKVHGRLPLSPYLLAGIGVPDVDEQGHVATWTPRTFVERADSLFLSRTGKAR
jgi:hypothetical protein